VASGGIFRNSSWWPKYMQKDMGKKLAPSLSKNVISKKKTHIMFACTMKKLTKHWGRNFYFHFDPDYRKKMTEEALIGLFSNQMQNNKKLSFEIL